jgi:hypothetical protein
MKWRSPDVSHLNRPGAGDCDAAEIGEEWARYLNTTLVKDCNSLSIRNWRIAHQDEFPILSQVALAISAMSVEVERDFSGYHQEFSMH